MCAQNRERRDTSNIFNTSMHLSLSAFLEHGKAYMVTIEDALLSIDRVKEQLQTWDAIWPDQCDIVASSLHRIRQPIHAFSGFLSQTSQLPITVIPAKYSFVAELDYFEVQIHKLLASLTSIHALYQRQSRPLYRQRLEILQKIEELLRRGEEVHQQIATWLASLYLQA